MSYCMLIVEVGWNLVELNKARAYPKVSGRQHTRDLACSRQNRGESTPTSMGSHQHF